MSNLVRIGTQNNSIEYRDRPTVKVIISKGRDVLILNNGLLPGGGIEPDETDFQAIERELAEELGASVENISVIGEVVQYRDFLKRRYVVNGYSADLVAFDKEPNPQDEREAQLTVGWHTVDVALELVEASIRHYDNIAIVDDSQQGKLYNLQTTRELLRQFKLI